MTRLIAGIESLLPQDPAEVGRFRLVGRLGAGGMGVVYAGVSATGQRVAVKVVHAELAHDPEFRARFAREIRLLGKIQSACTVRVLDGDAEADRPWFATEYVPGPTLRAHVDAAGPLAGDELYGVASGLAEALLSMHAAGVVHRDLKPANVILSPSGPKVVDLGIARAVDDVGVTRTGMLFGSPGWLSPEHYRHGPVGPAADVHAWGLLIAFAGTGRLPFGSGRPEVMAVRVLQDEADLAGIDAELSPIVAAALAKAPGDRPSAAGVLAAVTEAWRRRTSADVHDLPDGDAATALLQRTWLMPDVDDPAWAFVSPDGAPVRGERRRLRTPILLTLGGTLLGAAALAAVLASSHPGGPRRAAHGSPAPSAGRSAESQGSRVSLGPDVSAVVPAGWSVTSGTDDIGRYVCILAPGISGGSGGECMNHGVLLQKWTETDPDLGEADAWMGDNDESALPQCFAPDQGGAIGISSASVGGASSRRLGDRPAIYREYHVTCGADVTFTPRVWWLPQSRLMMTVVALPDRYRRTVDRIAASIRFG